MAVLQDYYYFLNYGIVSISHPRKEHSVHLREHLFGFRVKTVLPLKMSCIHEDSSFFTVSKYMRMIDSHSQDLMTIKQPNQAYIVVVWW